MKRRRLPWALVAVATMSGCSGPVTGSPLADITRVTSSPPPSSTSSVSRSIDPCALLSAADVQRHGLTLNGPDHDGRGCSWTNQTESYSLGVQIWDDARLGQLSTLGRTITDYPMGSRPGRLVLLHGGGGCGVFVGITATSMADVGDVTGGRTDSENCRLAEQYAAIAEPKLPAQ